MRYNRKDLRSEEPENIVEMVKKRAGVYRIYLASNRSINRLIGSDQSGLLYIGHAKQSNSLLKRIRDFFDSATNRNAKGEPPTTHQAGRFYQLHLKEHLGEAIDKLEFEFEITSCDSEAIMEEIIQLEDYLKSYGELPPLNYQLPKST